MTTFNTHYFLTMVTFPLKHYTFRHNKFLRPLLIEAAWTAVRKDPALTLRFNELIKQMSKQKAIIRIAKKLLRRIRHVWINQDSYVKALVA